ncbi:hypothetical protein T492DRAFT_877045 [Pavlovales sp. CCMP2436]|nr:hypothetical protein T492DRAFT_877045 [Pavlovales sp. CCMP2436]
MYGVPLGFACSADGSIALSIKIYGIPLGSVEFVALTLASKCYQITGTSQKLSSLLGLKHKQALWAITVNSTAHKGGYWAQHCFPDENIDFCLGVDNDILKQASVALGCDPTTDWLAHKRLYLPTRLAGLGLPSLSETRSAAFVASAARAATSFLDQHDATGTVTVHGVLERPSIAERIGRDSFAAPGSQDWRKFGDSDSHLGGQPSQPVPPCALACHPEEMGLRGKGLHGAGLQAAIKSDLQQIEHETLSEQLAHRPRGDRQMQLFRNISCESMIVFTVLPAGLAKVPNDEWTEISARVSGRNTTHVDPYGDTLAAAANFQGGHFAKLQHDPVVRAVARFATVRRFYARAATIDVYVELDQPDGQAAVGNIVEVKTVHYGLTHYNAVAPTRSHAVENRSGKLNAERRRQLQQTDRELKSLDNLLKNFAGMGAETWMGKLSAPTTMQARNTLLGLSSELVIARARSLHTQITRAAAGAQGAPWFQRTGRSTNGPEDAPAHADGAYCDDNWRSHNADRGARLGRGGRGDRGGQDTRTEMDGSVVVTVLGLAATKAVGSALGWEAETAAGLDLGSVAGSAKATVAGWVRSSTVRVPFVLVTDPGPDPDDVKALLVAAMLHLHNRIELCAVICNGGGQPRERAQLARCLLDHLGAANVPVGIGSEGTPCSAQPHEYGIAGYAAVEPSRLLDGRTLMLKVLQCAKPKSLRVVLISSLRDFADAVASHPSLVLEKVHMVAVQGGLEPDPTRPSGWRADTSVNNLFDIAAADAVYTFCFAHSIRLTVVSRHAVPLLPMQLARSFAERTNCPVIHYLADAQFLGLVGLWNKLCTGQLPARCSKQWFFETFCSEDAGTFASRDRDALDERTDINTYLTGHVKPYDVVALMTVLPQTEALFVSPAVLVPETALLLLTAEDAVPVEHVLNLLRDTSFATAKISPQLRGEFGMRAARPLLLCSDALGALRHSALGAEPLAPVEIARVLANHLGFARAQQQMVTRVATLGGLCMFGAGLVALLVDDALTSARLQPGESSYTHAGFSLRTYFYSLLSMLIYFAEAKTQFDVANAEPDRPLALIAIKRAYFACRVAEYVVIPLVLLGRMVVSWRRPRALVAAVFTAAGTLFVCQSMLDAALIGLLLGRVILREHPPWFLAGIAVFSLLKLTIGYAMLSKNALLNGRALIVSISIKLGVQREEAGGGDASLAPLLGFGTLREREPQELVQEAVRAFVPLVASKQSLRALGREALFGSADAEDGVMTQRSSPGGRAAWRARAPPLANGGAEQDAATGLPPMASAEYYVVHGRHDNPQAKLDALAGWVSEFERAHDGRSPSIFIGGVCAGISPVEQLEHMPVYVARSKRLLILAGPELPAQLWCAMECYTWFALGGCIEKVEVAIVGADAENIGAVVSAFDAFHVMYSLSDGDTAARGRLMAATELAGIIQFNATLRELVPRASCTLL